MIAWSFMMNLGQTVREQRTKRNLSQKELALLAGVGSNFVYQLEKNKASVQLDAVKKVLDSLDLKIEVSPKKVFRHDPWNQNAS